ncbi:MAG: hypothetical protein IJ566_00390 [Cardiobacteriaceae bacterium]|nr:hypothetical protein [Cardiobacteriaceae bacterium]
MLKTQLVEALFTLASEKYQHQHIDNATVDEYETPNELLNYAFSSLENIRHKIIQQIPEFSYDECEVLMRYLYRLEYLCQKYDNLYKSDKWKDVMNESLNLLTYLGYSLDKFDEEGNLNQ